MSLAERFRRLVGGVGGSKVSEGSNSPFRIAAGQDRPTGAPVEENDPTAPAERRIDDMVRSSEVFLFIKGTPRQPMCGFSANTVAIVDTLGVPYATFDVLSDESIREAAKVYSQWPTFPQVYIRGEFVGGNDIITEMYSTGELRAALEGTAS